MYSYKICFILYVRACANGREEGGRGGKGECLNQEEITRIAYMIKHYVRHVK